MTGELRGTRGASGLIWLIPVAIVAVSVVRIVDLDKGNVPRTVADIAITLGAVAAGLLILWGGFSLGIRDARRQVRRLVLASPGAVFAVCWALPPVRKVIREAGEPGLETTTPFFVVVGAASAGIQIWAPDNGADKLLWQASWDMLEQPEVTRTWAYGRMVPAVLLSTSSAQLPLVVASLPLAGMLPAGYAVTSSFGGAIASIRGNHITAN